MKIVIFGLTISSSWGNGHATLWRGLCRALAARRHQVVFFEQDRPYYAAHRDLSTLPAGSRIEFYRDWTEALPRARRELADADVGLVTSYCGDGISATELLAESTVPRRVFYDLDTPITLQALENGEALSYIGPRGLADFDLVLSYTGGRALDELVARLGVRRVAPFYGSVDPTVHRPQPVEERFRCSLSYLGTYAADRQSTLEELFMEPAARQPARRFLIGGAQYPASFPWAPNIFFARHLEPAQHPAFFCSSDLTLNVTRLAMKSMGYCPSGRLFEAAACGAAIITDHWLGLDSFFAPGEEILVANSAAGVLEVLSLPESARRSIGAAARERALAEHTAAHRVLELERLLAETPPARQPEAAAEALEA
jgi:spore maturation protein CgeB